MKTLDQVEARVIVNAINTPGDAANTFIITQRGSYYLTGNLDGAAGKHGISIRANDVTLDLNGFALSGGGGGTVRGIDVPALQTGLCVRNGNISGWSGDGVQGQLATMLAERLTLSNNGGIGLAVSNGSLVRVCVASGNGTGFFSDDRVQIIDCIATVNSGDGFNCTNFVTLLDCTSSRNGGNGIVVLDGSSVLRCSSTRNIPSGHGIFLRSGCTIADCTANNNGFDGIRQDTGVGGAIRNCTAQANSGSGITVRDRCQVTGNTCDVNANGILVGGNYNRVDGNSCSLNTQNQFIAIAASFFSTFTRNYASGVSPYNVNAFQAIGPIESSSTGVLQSTSPWANFAP